MKIMSKLNLLTAVIALLSSQTGFGDTMVLEEVTVTAQKREQSLQDVGVSVTAFTGEQISALGLTNSKDIAAQTPNLMFIDHGTSAINLVNIRGVSQNDFSSHQEAPNAVYVDQAYVSIIPAQSFALLDLERVEVLRGPQGTLYGRNATGGLVHYLSKKPTEEFDAFFDVTMGEYSRKRVEGAVGGALGSVARGRFSVLWEEHDGWLENTVGEDQNNADDLTLRGQLAFDLNDDAELLLSATYGEADRSQSYLHSSNGFNADGLEIDLPRDVDFYGTGPGADPSGYRRDVGFFDVEVDTEGRYEPTYANLNAILTWDLGEVTLTSVTNYQDFDLDYLEDSDASPRLGLNIGSEQKINQFSQEIRFSGETETIRWLAGGYYLNIDGDYNLNTDGELGYLDDLFSVFGVINPGDLDGGGTLRDLGLFDTLANQWSLETTSWAVFGQAEFDLSESLTLISGLRWTDDEKEYTYLSREFYAGFETTDIPELQVWGTTDFDDDQSESDWSGKLQLDWRINDDVLAYIGSSRGIKAGSFNAPITGGDVSSFGQETLTSYEAGIKSTLADGKVRFNTSVFYYDYKDYQGFTFEALATRIVNLDATSQGAEFEFTWSPGGGWDVLLGASLLDTEVKEVTLPSGRMTDTELPMAPRYTINGLVRKAWELGGHELAVQVDFNHTDGYYSDVLNNPSAEIDSYTITNLRLSYGRLDGRWEVALLGRNLTDEETFSYGIPTTLGFNENAVIPPRWINLRFVYRWAR